MSNPVKLEKISDAQLKAEFEATLTGQSKSNPELAAVPDQFKKFFQAFSSKKQGSGTMDLSGGRARPEEMEVLLAEGWDGVSELPSNIADLRSNQASVRAKANEAALRKLEQKESLSLEDLEVSDFASAPKEQQQMVVDMMKKMGSPEVINSRKSTVSSAKQPPVEVVPSTPTSVSNLLDSVRNPAPVVEEKKVAPVTEQPAPEKHICPRCSCDLTKEYKIKPSDADIQNRLLAILSTTQGGDGRFKKAYSLFGGKVVVTFRELVDEGSIIYQEESSLALSNESDKATLQRMFSMDRISFRRHCCSIESVNIAGKLIKVPPLSAWIQNSNGDAGAALQAMESAVRSQVYTSESILMAAGKAWADFEALITAMWMDQSFYNGTP